MNRYWDLDERKRVKLSSEEVEKFLDVELMERGVQKVGDLQLREITDITVARKQFFSVVWSRSTYSKETLCVCETVEQAQAIIDACPLKEDWDYDCGSEFKFARHMTDLSIEPVELATEQEVLELKPKLQRRQKDKEYNDKIKSTHDKQVKAVREATEDVWNDWHELQGRQSDADSVKATLDEYIELCDGDEEKAEVFLRKTINSDRVDAAFRWLGIPSRLPQAVPATAE